MRMADFEIPTLPVGTWDFVMWHERPGWVASDRFPNGRFQLTIEPDINALGDIPAAPEVFARTSRSVAWQVATRSATTSTSPRHGSSRRARD